MLKRAIVVAGVALAALALAVLTVQGAKGRGVAINDHGIRAHFGMDVKKGTDGQHTRVGGSFAFKAMLANARSIEIHMPMCREFVKDGHVAEFGGPARAIIIEGRHRVVREGPLHVRVNDRRAPRHPGEPDQLSLRFSNPNNTGVFEYAGLVHEGDIVVYERTGP